ncbi:hypothetical protein GCM10010377_14920 [Streptomyces viridiviolaceus]|uniref:Uncharacterized protein n=1 Tax=Streptomyces viridiviolaceus TaxID=68282 RepID=A0ABW2DYI2_9ACTN|nr:hypothetical protein [Streptomyces viridiviolaceus]GHB25908.1 hypothetical protein GCM10010377_14920 [Streptomyces viridiviolaceus]
MLNDPYAVLRALLRAEAARRTPKPDSKSEDPRDRQRPAREGRRD